jgi:hypothetical protein
MNCSVDVFRRHTDSNRRGLAQAARVPKNDQLQGVSWRDALIDRHTGPARERLAAGNESATYRLREWLKKIPAIARPRKLYAQPTETKIGPDCEQGQKKHLESRGKR